MTFASDLDAIAARIRARVVEMSHVAETPHLGSSLSCIDMIVAAYWGFLRIDPKHALDPDRDRFILSKGHAATALYATLAERGFFDSALLDVYDTDGAALAEHPGLQCVPGVEAATGSLGHGLSIALGMALAARIQGRSSRCLVLMSDGECEEGSVWEAAMFAPAHKLESVTVMIDYNKWQATGRSDEIMALAPLADKWRAFGWETCEVNGHDIGSLAVTLSKSPDGSRRPRAIVCHTVKGKGVSFMEDDNNWHYRIPTADEVRKARVELGQPEVGA
jgi:transketolase